MLYITLYIIFSNKIFLEKKKRCFRFIRVQFGKYPVTNLHTFGIHAREIYIRKVTRNGDADIKSEREKKRLIYYSVIFVRETKKQSVFFYFEILNFSTRFFFFLSIFLPSRQGNIIN